MLTESGEQREKEDSRKPGIQQKRVARGLPGWQRAAQPAAQPAGTQAGAAGRAPADREGSSENGIDRLCDQAEYAGKRIMTGRRANGENSRLGTQLTLQIEHNT